MDGNHGICSRGTFDFRSSNPYKSTTSTQDKRGGEGITSRVEEIDRICLKHSSVEGRRQGLHIGRDTTGRPESGVRGRSRSTVSKESIQDISSARSLVSEVLIEEISPCPIGLDRRIFQSYTSENTQTQKRNTDKNSTTSSVS